MRQASGPPNGQLILAQDVSRWVETEVESERGLVRLGVLFGCQGVGGCLKLSQGLGAATCGI